MSKNILLIITITLVINSCITSRGLEFNQRKSAQSGWLENLGDLGSSNGLFFLRKHAEASDTAKEKKSGSKMQESCISNAQKNIKSEIISEIAKSNSTNSIPKEKEVTLIESSISSVNIRECQPTGEKNKEIPFSEWEACECMFHANISGGKDMFLSKTGDL